MYTHKVQYYETDKMGITHHSNYIRWMEEARIDFLDQLGIGFDKLEADGIVSPVIGVDCEYKKTTTFPDVINIEVKIEEFKGVKLTLYYEMKNSKDEVVCLGRSRHCFLNSEGMPVRLNKEQPKLYEILTNVTIINK